MAQRVSVVQVVVSDFEVGKLRLAAEMASRFSTALDVPIQELLQISKPLPLETPCKRIAESCNVWRRSNACHVEARGTADHD
jgi:hypothetical protein